MFQTYYKLIAMVLILSQVSNSSEISSNEANGDVIHQVEVNPAPFSLEPAISGPKSSPPRYLTATENDNGTLISWKPPLERYNLVEYYTVKYKTDGPYRNLNKNKIGPEETSYLVKNFVGCRTYHFRVLAYTSKNFESSDEITYVVPARVKLNSSPSTMTCSSGQNSGNSLNQHFNFIIYFLILRTSISVCS